MIHAKGKLIFFTSTENQLESNPSHISVPLKYDYFKISLSIKNMYTVCSFSPK